jgi:uncharacterized protein YoxC
MKQKTILIVTDNLPEHDNVVDDINSSSRKQSTRHTRKSRDTVSQSTDMRTSDTVNAVAAKVRKF